MSYFLAQDIKLYIEDGITVHKLSIQSDFQYNRSGRVKKITRESLNPTGDRSIIPIVEEVGPINFSFSTYAEIDDSAANVTSAQKLLWRGLMGNSNGLSETTSNFTCNFGSSTDIPYLNPLTIYIEHSNKIIKLTKVVIDDAIINIKLDSILNINWKGTALNYEEVGALPSVDIDYTILGECIKTKFSTISLNRNSINYNLALISGSVKISNNNVYYTRKEFGKSQTTIGHYTGSREISGNLNFYTKIETDGSYDLFDSLMLNATTDTTTAYANSLEVPSNIQIRLGGNTDDEHILISMPQTILGIPSQQFKNVINMNIPFVVQESSGNEVEIIYNKISIFRITSFEDNRITSTGDYRIYSLTAAALIDMSRVNSFGDTRVTSFGDNRTYK